jgi:hypothetical protein
MATQSETLEGYVLDIICARRYPQDELAERARAHTKACGLKGHCVESGYGLVDDEGRLFLLDSEATPLVVSAIRGSEKEKGIRLRAQRRMKNEEMRTVGVAEIDGASDGSS